MSLHAVSTFAFSLVLLLVAGNFARAFFSYQRRCGAAAARLRTQRDGARSLCEALHGMSQRACR
jgi:hypothetical protein